MPRKCNTSQSRIPIRKQNLREHNTQLLRKQNPWILPPRAALKNPRSRVQKLLDRYETLSNLSSIDAMGIDKNPPPTKQKDAIVSSPPDQQEAGASASDADTRIQQSSTTPVDINAPSKEVSMPSESNLVQTTPTESAADHSKNFSAGKFTYVLGSPKQSPPPHKAQPSTHEPFSSLTTISLDEESIRFLQRVSSPNYENEIMRRVKDVLNESFRMVHDKLFSQMNEECARIQQITTAVRTIVEFDEP